MPDLITIAQQFPYPGLFILLILGGLGLPVPEDATLMLFGFLLFHEIVRPLPAFLVVYAGLLTADLLIYHFGKKYGQRITGHRWFKKYLSPARLAQLEDRFKKKGFLFILAGRHLVGLRVQLFLAAGVTGMPLPRFLLADALSSTITLAVMTGLGYAAGNSFDAMRRDVARTEHYLALAAIAAVFVFFMLRRRRRRKDMPGAPAP